MLWQQDVVVEEGKWTEIDLDSEALIIDPPTHFYVGHVVDST
ncbi:MAG: hypothetical protein ACQES9_10905 [Myxococcota bacterium]